MLSRSPWCVKPAFKQKVKTSLVVPSCRRSCWASPPRDQSSPPPPAPARPEPCSLRFPPPRRCDCSSGSENGEEIKSHGLDPGQLSNKKRFEANKLPICSRLIAVNANRLTFHKLNTIWRRGSRALRVYTHKSTEQLLHLDNEGGNKRNKNTFGKCVNSTDASFAL